MVIVLSLVVHYASADVFGVADTLVLPKMIDV